MTTHAEDEKGKSSLPARISVMSARALLSFLFILITALVLLILIAHTLMN
jgi:hypothetical protein